MKVTVGRKVLSRFKRKARERFDTEEFGILLGSTSTDGVLVAAVYFPPFRLDEATNEDVELDCDWYYDANEYGKNLGLVVVGDIHSHCYQYRPDLSPPDHTPSESDWDSADMLRGLFPSYSLFGVCRVVQLKNKRLKSSIKLWTIPESLELAVV
jgi:hypothetical protein